MAAVEPAINLERPLFSIKQVAFRKLLHVLGGAFKREPEVVGYLIYNKRFALG